MTDGFKDEDIGPVDHLITAALYAGMSMGFSLVLRKLVAMWVREQPADPPRQAGGGVE